MSGAVFYWIGVIVVAALAIGATAFALLYAYAMLVYRRFQMIAFRRAERRLSIASWHGSRITTAKHYNADDFPIGERPFYLGYRVGKRRLFVMLGTHGEARFSSMSGRHPEEAA